MTQGLQLFVGMWGDNYRHWIHFHFKNTPRQVCVDYLRVHQINVTAGKISLCSHQMNEHLP